MADVIDPGPDDPRLTLRALGEGFQIAQGVSVMARLGIADLLADDARTSDELAALAGADPGALYRLLRALATVGVLVEEDGRRFSLTAVGEGLRTDVEGSLNGWVAFIGSPLLWQAWGDLEHSVRTGANAFQHLHGEDVWTYRSTRPEESALFDRAMASLSHQQRQAVSVYDFTPFATIADVGGGTGSFLARILDRRRRPRHPVRPAARRRRRAGRARRGRGRRSVRGGGRQLLRWRAGRRRRLRAAGRGARLGGRRRGADPGRRAPGDPRPRPDPARRARRRPPNEGRAAKWSDLNMLVSPGGRERTEAEYAELLARAGFRCDRRRPRPDAQLRRGRAGLIGVSASRCNRPSAAPSAPVCLVIAWRGSPIRSRAFALSALPGAGDRAVVVLDGLSRLSRVGVAHDVVDDDLARRHQRQLEHLVPGERTDAVWNSCGGRRTPRATRPRGPGAGGTAPSPPGRVAIGVGGSELGDERLADRPRLEQPRVGGAGEMEVEGRGGPGWRGRWCRRSVRRRDHAGSRSGPGPRAAASPRARSRG